MVLAGVHRRLNLYMYMSVFVHVSVGRQVFVAITDLLYQTLLILYEWQPEAKSKFPKAV